MLNRQYNKQTNKGESMYESVLYVGKDILLEPVEQKDGVILRIGRMTQHQSAPLQLPKHSKPLAYMRKRISWACEDKAPVNANILGKMLYSSKKPIQVKVSAERTSAVVLFQMGDFKVAAPYPMMWYEKAASGNPGMYIQDGVGATGYAHAVIWDDAYISLADIEVVRSYYCGEDVTKMLHCYANPDAEECLKVSRKGSWIIRDGRLEMRFFSHLNKEATSILMEWLRGRQ
jgi:hypothetical protein